VNTPDSHYAIQRDLGRLEKNADSTLLKSNNGKSCTWGGITSCTSTGWGLTGWKAAWQKEELAQR